MSAGKHVCEKRGKSNCEPCIKWRVDLWNAINRYVEACGGKPSARLYGNTSRMNAVCDVDRVIVDAADKDEIR